MKKQLDDQDKARKAAVMTSVVEETKAFVTANKELPWVVRRLEAYSNTKVSARRVPAGRAGSLLCGAVRISKEAEVWRATRCGSTAGVWLTCSDIGVIPRSVSVQLLGPVLCRERSPWRAVTAFPDRPAVT